MSSYTYEGTRITGTDYTPRRFPNSGIAFAKMGNTYLNTTTGNVYECRMQGNPNDAKWSYVKTDPITNPSLAVSNLTAPEKLGATRMMRSTWRNPNTWEIHHARMTHANVTWSVGTSAGELTKVKWRGNARYHEEDIISLDAFAGRSRYSYYPFTNDKLNYVSVEVYLENDFGKGPAVTATRTYYKPRAPWITDFVLDTQNSTISCTVNTDAGTDYYERWDTRYRLIVTDTRIGKTSVLIDASTSETSFPVTYKYENIQALDLSQYIKVTVEAWARGYAGDSDKASRSYFISHAAKANILDVKITAKDSAGKAIVSLKTNSSVEHPVDGVVAEYLADVTYANPEDIPLGARWTASSIKDTGSCTATILPVSDIAPDRGHYSWVRIKTWHITEDVLYRYSDPVRIKDLEMPPPSAADDKIKILSVVAGANGKSARVELVWDDGDTPSTGTELSWDTEYDAWRSTKAPSEYQFTWSDGPREVDGVTWPDSATITIKDLDITAKYYIRARRYLEGEWASESEYTSSTVITGEKPEAIVAVCDRYLPIGQSLQVNWSFAGAAMQTEWQIISSNGAVIVNGEGASGSAQISSERLMEFAGENSVTFTVQASSGGEYVSSEEHTVTLVQLPEITVDAESTLTAQPFSFGLMSTKICDLVVIVSSQGAAGQFPNGQKMQTPGDTVYSNVISPIWWPTNATMAKTSDVTVDLTKSYYVLDEKGSYHIEGERYEEVGNPVDEDIGTYYEMGVIEDDGTVTTVVTLPTGLDFWHLAKYTLSVVGIDPTYGLNSNEAIHEFNIQWAHVAPSILPVLTYSLSSDTKVDINKNYYTYDSETETYDVVMGASDENPSEEGWYEQQSSECVTISYEDSYDDSGAHHQAATITLTPPPDSVETDVYDIYRLTGDGAVLIGEGYPLSYVAVDEYAPFGEDASQSYRIAVRTIDGDIAFSDVAYVAEGLLMRLDWATGSLELPYGMDYGDAYSKDVEIRQHMDGSSDGYWNPNISRKGKLSSDIIKLVQPKEVAMARELGRYAGPVFVRLPDGSAYEADVQVTDLSRKNPAVTSIAIDATEIGLTGEFMLPPQMEGE